MIVCPVCEHQQAQGAECEKCGKVFAPADLKAVPVERLEGYERTAIADPRLKVTPETMPELEANAVRKGPDLPAVRLQDLDRHIVDAVGELPVQPLPDVEYGREQGDGARVAPPVGPLTCRYCRSVQAEGLFCEKCGMRLPRLEVADVDAPADPSAVQWTRCKKCGAPAKAGFRCGDCAQYVPFPDE